MIRTSYVMVAAAIAHCAMAKGGMGGMSGKNMAGRLTARIGPYPGTSSNEIDGSVSVGFNDDGVMLIQMNVDGLPNGMTNAGVHIHAGTSCNTTADPLGHYWDTDLFGSDSADDPWNTYNSSAGTRYTSNGEGVSDSAISNVYSGYGYSENSGRVVVMHNDAGDRIGCGVLVPEYGSLKTGYLEAYPGYAGDLDVSGKVKVEFALDRTFSVSWNLMGVRAGCTDCGIHVHEGTTCDNSGGHWWIPSKMVDLWTAVGGAVYNADGKGKAKGYYYLSSGHSAGAFVDHAVVVHDQDGTRVACATLMASSSRGGKSANLVSGTSGAAMDTTAGKFALISGGVLVVAAALVVAKKFRGKNAADVQQKLPLIAADLK